MEVKEDFLEFKNYCYGKNNEQSAESCRNFCKGTCHAKCGKCDDNNSCICEKPEEDYY